jgi:hypothetical protein
MFEAAIVNVYSSKIYFKDRSEKIIYIRLHSNLCQKESSCKLHLSYNEVYKIIEE